jgi:hypothetical protein
VRLGRCGAGDCPFLDRRDQRVDVVYEADRPGSARLAAAVAGSPLLHPLVLLFGGLGALLLVAVAINVALETWSP